PELLGHLRATGPMFGGAGPWTWSWASRDDSRLDEPRSHQGLGRRQGQAPSCSAVAPLVVEGSLGGSWGRPVAYPIPPSSASLESTNSIPQPMSDEGSGFPSSARCMRVDASRRPKSVGCPSLLE